MGNAFCFSISHTKNGKCVREVPRIKLEDSQTEFSRVKLPSIIKNEYKNTNTRIG